MLGRHCSINLGWLPLQSAKPGATTLSYRHLAKQYHLNQQQEQQQKRWRQLTSPHDQHGW